MPLEINRSAKTILVGDRNMFISKSASDGRVYHMVLDTERLVWKLVQVIEGPGQHMSFCETIEVSENMDTLLITHSVAANRMVARSYYRNKTTGKYEECTYDAH